MPTLTSVATWVGPRGTPPQLLGHCHRMVSAHALVPEMRLCPATATAHACATTQSIAVESHSLRERKWVSESVTNPQNSSPLSATARNLQRWMYHTNSEHHETERLAASLSFQGWVPTNSRLSLFPPLPCRHAQAWMGQPGDHRCNGHHLPAVLQRQRLHGGPCRCFHPSILTLQPHTLRLRAPAHPLDRR